MEKAKKRKIITIVLTAAGTAVPLIFLIFDRTAGASRFFASDDIYSLFAQYGIPLAGAALNIVFLFVNRMKNGNGRFFIPRAAVISVVAAAGLILFSCLCLFVESL